MIPEATIEAQIEILENSDFAADLANFSTAQPYLMDYLSGEDTGAFTETEQELLFFATLVLYRSVEEGYGARSVIEGEDIAIAEEKIFATLQTQDAKAFRDRLTVFFDQSKEEDLLAFVEDLLVAEADSGITKEGREPLFVILKTVMDVILQND